MCAHYRIAQIQPLLDLFKVDPSRVAAAPSGFAGEGKPTDSVAALLRNPKSGDVELRYLKWGLVPSWAKPDWVATKCINARAETLTERPAYREAYQKRRCILPMESFFEFDQTSRYSLCMADGSPMAVAGLWEARKIGNERPLVTCTMITTGPNELIATIHDRMPAILRPEHCERWLDPAADLAELRSLLVPLEPSLMTMRLDGPRKNSRSRREAQPETETGDLFA